MNTIDIAIVILLLWGAIIGFIKGFVVQALTLIALVLGVWAGAEFYGPIGDFFSKHFSWNTKVAQIAAFCAIFTAILIAVFYLSKLLTNLMGKSVLGRLNRIGGSIFGMIKMAFIASVLIFIILKIDKNRKLLTEELTNGSKLFPMVERMAPTIFPHIRMDEIKNNLLKT